MIQQDKNIENISLKNIITGEIAALLSFYVEFYLCIDFINDKISLTELLKYHFYVVLTLLLLTIFLVIYKVSCKIFIFILIETTVAGPMGSLTAVISMIFYIIFITKKIFLEKKFEQLHPEIHQSISEKVFSKVMWDTPSESVKTEPFGDILKYGTIKEKQNALIKIKKYFKPEFAPFLQIGVEDRDNSIRVQAAAIITSLEEKLMQNYQQFEIQLSDNEFSPMLVRDYFRTYISYAKTGLINIDKYNDIMDDLTSKMFSFINNSSDEENSIKIVDMIYLANIYLLTGKPEQAYELLHEKGIHIRNFPRSPKALKLYLNAAFELKKYSEIREYLALNKDLLIKRTKQNQEIISLLNFWT